MVTAGTLRLPRRVPDPRSQVRDSLPQVELVDDGIAAKHRLGLVGLSAQDLIVGPCLSINRRGRAPSFVEGWPERLTGLGDHRHLVFNDVWLLSGAGEADDPDASLSTPVELHRSSVLLA